MDLKTLIERGEVIREPIVEKCKVNKREVIVNKKPVIMEKGPCNRVDDNICAAYIKPSAKWKNGDCPLASHIIQVEDEQKFINPLKASKRARG